MQKKNKANLLGISASLRNARWGIGNQELIDSLKVMSTKDELFTFLTEESDLHLENFLAAGRRKKKPFNEIYKNLKKNKGTKGLSNSEVALAAALWAAYKRNVDIDHISLSEYFPASGKTRKAGELKKKLISADGILISGPVYFGDRSSLVQELVDMIRGDADLRHKMEGKIYGGITVGAKRNGGQETTLIYQLLDLVSLGLLAVGNDSETTAQYGGTCHAGDVGTMHKDSYGLNTSMGTGRRVADLTRLLNYRRELEGPVRVLFLILQDSKGLAMKRVKDIISTCSTEISPTIIDISNKNIQRCIACDICPTDIDIDEVYRCIITSNSDDLKSLHKVLLNHDAIVPVVASVNDVNSIKTNYQNFIERTRYLRRGDFVFSNALVVPLIFEDVSIARHYSIRLITSMIRHHTVITEPITGHLSKGKLLNNKQIHSEFKNFVASARRLVAACLAEAHTEDSVKYHPVGYVLSASKDIEDERMKKREHLVQQRNDRIRLNAEKRLKPFLDQEGI